MLVEVIRIVFGRLVFERYIRGKTLGKLIWRSIQNGPTPHPQITMTEGHVDRCSIQVSKGQAGMEELLRIKNKKELADIQGNQHSQSKGSQAVIQHTKPDSYWERDLGQCRASNERKSVDHLRCTGRKHLDSDVESDIDDIMIPCSNRELKQGKLPQPTLYDGHALLNPTHTSVKVHYSEDSLVHIEVSKTKMSKRLGTIKPINYAELNALYSHFVPQKELSREQGCIPTVQKPNPPLNLANLCQRATLRTIVFLPVNVVNARNVRRAAYHNKKLNVIDHNQFVIRSLKFANTKTPQAKHSVNHTKKVWKATRNHNVNTTKTAWRPIGKVVGSVKPQWKPTG
ncbi:hypothetical protein Tco_0877852 [Tanacetum coccineum]|uniref:Uncharacterized protein n=1 Tax=Tanacetum coccineum TaxID=301880 RepID=A0ABQ5BWB4_9ASTR